MNETRLFHFSEDSSIETFIPRPVRVPSQRPPGKEWLNGPLVWAIEESVDFMYLFPRDCPRILVWATERTTEADVSVWLGENRAVAYIERYRVPELERVELYRYALPAKTFENLEDAGMWVSRAAVTPVRCERISDLANSFAPRGVELRVVDSLVPLRALWETSLHVSGIRLRNALGWIQDV